MSESAMDMQFYVKRITLRKYMFVYKLFRRIRK